VVSSGPLDRSEALVPGSPAEILAGCGQYVDTGDPRNRLCFSCAAHRPQPHRLLRCDEKALEADATALTRHGIGPLACCHLQGSPREVVSAGRHQDIADMTAHPHVDLDNARAVASQLHLRAGHAIRDAERRGSGRGEREDL
jgi:hypothetical protein